MNSTIHHPEETKSNTERTVALQYEPRSLRTYTPSQAVLAHSAGIYHWTPEGKRLYDFSSGVLVANLGHNPISWMQRFSRYMKWSADEDTAEAFPGDVNDIPTGYFAALPMTAYNGVTPIEGLASRRLIEVLQKTPYGQRLQQVMWAASGSEAIQKAIWTGWASDRNRPMIIATRFGFHGKKGMAGAITGCETDHERDARVRFISFPMKEYDDVSRREVPFDPLPYRKELDALYAELGNKIGVLITEPYLGGGGSYHPPKEYLQLLQAFCRQHDIVFILDEVQANFGRTGDLFAFETYQVEPDIVVLGKGLGNGVPVAAAVGRRDLFNHLDYGEGSDTWSANPLCCASVLATLDEFAASDVLGEARKSSALIEAGLRKLQEFPFVAKVRGENGGMVWGVEMRDHAGKTAAQWANALVLEAYRGEGSVGIHLLGPLAKKVIRFSPPLTITLEEATAAIDLLRRCVSRLAETSSPAPILAGTV